jgi:6-phosphofructokinase 1
VCKDKGIDALVCIGGDGSFRGSELLWKEHRLPVIGLPGTIDNDIYGTDLTIGYDTAVNTALEAIDRIRDTAASHDRLFIVEVMGRNSGFIAIDVAVAGGAEDVFIPENPTGIDEAIQHIQKGIARGKSSSILVTAEGQKPGRAYDLAEAIRKKSGFESKVCILGHIQRGGAPTATDRILASRLGAAAVDHLKAGVCNGMLGVLSGKVHFVGFEECLVKKRSISPELIRLAQVLSI